MQAHVRALGAGSGYDADDTHCTDAAGVWFREEVTNEFICAVRRRRRLRLVRRPRRPRARRRATVMLDRRDAGRTLGF